MFKFLKDKIGGALSKFSKSVEEESVEEEVVEETEVEVEETEELDKQEKELQAELKKVEKEKKQKEKELKKIEENQKKAEEKQKKAEEKNKEKEKAAAKKLEEENKKIEESKQKKLEEEKKILEEEKAKLEQQKLDEKELQKKEEAEIKKLEEEKLKAEEDEEKKRIEEEEKKKEIEKKKHELEEKRRQEQQLKIIEEEEKKREILEEELKKSKERGVSDEEKREEAQLKQIKKEEVEEKLGDDDKKAEFGGEVIEDEQVAAKILTEENQYEIERLEKEKEDLKKKEEELKSQTDEIQEKKGFFSKLKSKITGKKEEEPVEEVVEEEKEEVKEEEKEEPKEEPEEEKEEVEVIKKSEGLFAKIKKKVTTKTLSEEKFDDLFWDLELAMLENNVAVEVIEKIKDDLKKDIVNTPLKKSEIQSHILESLKKSIESLFQDSNFDLVKTIHEGKKPFKIVFVGINGSGKTTTIAKFARFLQKHHFSSVLVAADTFRAAAIQQLEEHGNKLEIPVIKQDYGSDPAAVCYDGIQMANARNIDVVLIDTAGRLHSNINLMDEMTKIVRVAEPDLILFVGESITGNDCVDQAKNFNKAVELDGIVLSKADIDEKGGAAISVSYVTKKPILFLGTGQEYDDLESFDKYKILESMGL